MTTAKELIRVLRSPTEATVTVVRFVRQRVYNLQRWHTGVPDEPGQETRRWREFTLREHKEALSEAWRYYYYNVWVRDWPAEAEKEREKRRKQAEKDYELGSKLAASTARAAAGAARQAAGQAVNSEEADRLRSFIYSRAALFREAMDNFIGGYKAATEVGEDEAAADTKRMTQALRSFDLEELTEAVSDMVNRKGGEEKAESADNNMVDANDTTTRLNSDNGEARHDATVETRDASPGATRVSTPVSN